LVLVDEFFLFFAFGFEKKASDLVITTADALQQAIGPAEGISGLERLLQVALDLAGTVELPGLDFGFELLDLSGRKVTGIALVMEDQKGIKTLVAEDAEPIANRSWAKVK